MATALDAAGNEMRATPVHHYPLPPALPGYAEPLFNGNGQYRLPDPVTGKLTSYTRATTVAKALEDTYMLEAWKRRHVLMGMSLRPDLGDQLDTLIRKHHRGETDLDDLRDPLNRMAEDAMQTAGTSAYAEFGTAVHAWTEVVDLRVCLLSDVPDIFRSHVHKHLYLLCQNGLTVDPVGVERRILNTKCGIAGTLDRIFWGPDGVRLLGDVKTSKSLDYSWLSFSIQLAIYQSADFMLSLDGTRWEPMPELDASRALVVHLPSTDWIAGTVQPINLEFGRAALEEALRVRNLRSRAPKEVPLHSETTHDKRWYEARYEIEISQTREDVAELWVQYQDIWNDDLTSLGMTICDLQAANATPPQRHERPLHD